MYPPSSRFRYSFNMTVDPPGFEFPLPHKVRHFFYFFFNKHLFLLSYNPTIFSKYSTRFSVCRSQEFLTQLGFTHGL